MTAETLAARIDAPIRVLKVRSRDGTSLTAYEAGRGREAMVLCPGLGGNLLGWKHVLEGFQGVYRMITWDPRGTYFSAAPDDPSRITVPDHVDDLEAVMEALGVTRCVLGGWSMGVQIAITYIHRHPDRMPRALLLIHGHPGHLLRDVLDLPPMEPVFRAALATLIPLSTCLQPVLGPLFRRPETLPLLNRLGLVAAREGIFPEVLKAFSHMYFPRYLRMIEQLGRHSTEAWLGEIRCPTLITAGSRDVMTPPSVARRARERIPGARLVVFEGGTHYTKMEMPDRMHRVLEEFLREVDPEAFAPLQPREPSSHRRPRASRPRTRRTPEPSPPGNAGFPGSR